MLSSENTAVAPEYGSVWMELETDLARLSTRGKQIVIDRSSGDLIYQAPDAIVEAVRQVLGDIQQQPRTLR